VGRLTPLSEARFIALQNYLVLARDQAIHQLDPNHVQPGRENVRGAAWPGIGAALIVTNLPISGPPCG